MGTLLFGKSPALESVRFVKMPNKGFTPVRVFRRGLHGAWVFLLEPVGGCPRVVYDYGRIANFAVLPSSEHVWLVKLLAEWKVIPRADAVAYAAHVEKLDAERDVRNAVHTLIRSCQQLEIKVPRLPKHLREFTERVPAYKKREQRRG